MDWLQSLLWDPSSVAHIVFLYAFVVAAGVYLGKIKIFGVSLGVTFVLFGPGYPCAVPVGCRSRQVAG